MKQLFFAFTILILFSSCSAQSIRILKSTDIAPRKNCPGCVQVRIKNSGKDAISKVVLSVGSVEYSFDGLKPGKTSTYKAISKLCSCGYDLDVYYVRTDSNKTVLHRECRNILPCTDYYKGKLKIDIKTAKLPQQLNTKEARRTETEANFIKE